VRVPRLTNIDLVNGHIEGLCKALLSGRAGFMLVLEMGLQDIMLFLCEARFDVGWDMGRPVWVRDAVWRMIRLHGGRAADGQQDGRGQTQWMLGRSLEDAGNAGVAGVAGNEVTEVEARCKQRAGVGGRAWSIATITGGHGARHGGNEGVGEQAVRSAEVGSDSE